jgi:hypothetical protein
MFTGTRRSSIWYSKPYLHFKEKGSHDVGDKYFNACHLATSALTAANPSTGIAIAIKIEDMKFI